MNDSARHVHIYLDGLPPGTTVHIHAGRAAAEATENAAHSAGEPPPSPEREMLRRLAAYGQASCLDSIYDRLEELGYLPKVPDVRVPGKQPEPYLSWFDPARGGPTVIRFTAEKLWFIRKDDIGQLADLPGGQTETENGKHNVNFPMTDSNVEAILQGARRLKR